MQGEYDVVQGPAVLQWWQAALCSSTDWAILQERDLPASWLDPSQGIHSG